MKLPFVSIIVLSYNGKRFLRDCLDSLKKIEYPKRKYEVIIVDNGSTDGSAEYVRKYFPRFRLMVLDKNYGFAEGNNRGLEIAQGEYIVFLNEDTKVDKNWLIELVKIAANDKIGICGSLIRDFNNLEMIQDSANFIDIFTNLVQVKMSLNNAVEVFSLRGVSMLVKRNFIKTMKYCFDPSYFAYFEETDLCWRARLLGYKVFFVPSSVVYHKGISNQSQVKPINIFRFTKNKILTVRKNFRSPLKEIFLLVVLLRTFVAVAYWTYKHKWGFNMKFLSSVISPVNYGIDLNKVSLKRQLSIFSLPSLKRWGYKPLVEIRGD